MPPGGKTIDRIYLKKCLKAGNWGGEKIFRNHGKGRLKSLPKNRPKRTIFL